MEYINLVAFVWLTFYIIYTVCLVNNNIGRRIGKVNMVPLILTITSLITIGVKIIGDIS